MNCESIHKMKFGLPDPASLDDTLGRRHSHQVAMILLQYQHSLVFKRIQSLVSTVETDAWSGIVRTHSEI